MTRWLAFAVGLLLLAWPVWADMYPDASNAKLPEARINLGLGSFVTAEQFGMRGDSMSAAGLTTTGGSTTPGGGVVTAADAGKLFFAPGLGAGGGLFSTTIIGAGQFAAAPAASTPSFYASDLVDIVNPATGTGHAPGDVITLTNGAATCSVLPQVTVDWTGVSSATIAAAGSGGFNGNYPLLGTSAGTGNANTRLLVDVTVTGGSIASINALRRGGQYSTNPPAPANEPVLSANSAAPGLTGAQLALGMGVYRPRLTRPGICSAAPSGTWTQSATTGSGTGASITLTMTAAGTYTIGTNNSAGLTAAMASAANPVIRFGTGTYLIGCAAPYTAGSKVSLQGEGRERTTLLVTPGCSIPAAGLLVWPATRDGGGLVDLTLDLNDALGSTVSISTVVPVIDYHGSNLLIDRAAIINMGTRNGRAIIVAIRADNNAITNWIVQNSRIAFKKTTPYQNHAIQAFPVVSPVGPGTAIGGLYLNNVIENGNITGEYGGTTVIGNKVSGWGYGPGIGTSGATGPFPWLKGNYFAGNIIQNSPGTPGEDGQSPNCMEAPGKEAVVIGNHMENCGGVVSFYGVGGRSVNNILKNLNRRYDAIAVPWLSAIKLDASSPDRDGSRFSSIGDHLIDDTGRTNQIAYSDFEYAGPLLGNSVKDLRITGPILPAVDSYTDDPDQTGRLAAETDFDLRRVWRRTAFNSAAIEFNNLPTAQVKHGKLECAELTPAAAATLQIQVGSGGVYNTTSYRYIGVNPPTALGTSTGTAPDYWSANTSALKIGTGLMNVGGANVLTATFGDMALGKQKQIFFTASYLRSDNEMVSVTGGGAYFVNAALTDIRLTFVDAGSVQQNFTSGRCTLTMWW